jgi:AcrR family transcriptional regulator
VSNETGPPLRSLESDVRTGAARRRERNRDEMRRLILAAARAIVQRDGLAALSMRAVAVEIGYSAAAIYEYYPSKTKLLESLFFEGTEGLAGYMRNEVARLPPAATPLEHLTVAGAAYRAFALDHAELYRLIFTTPMLHGPATLEQIEDDATFSFLAGMFRQGVEVSNFNEADPRIAALAAWSLVHGFVMLELLGLLPNEPLGIRDQLFEAIRKVLRDGLMARPDRMKPICVQPGKDRSV